MNRVAGLLCCFSLYMPGLISVPASAIEVTQYVDGKFEYECTSLNESSGIPPTWAINGTLFNSTDVNERYGAIINLSYIGEGIPVSTIIISPVTLKLNNSNLTCSADNVTVHLTVVEADLKYLPTENFSDICVNPSVISSHAPDFVYNGIRLNNIRINKLYGANVTRSISKDGHHQAHFEIHVTDLNPTLDSSTVECLVGSTVIWRYHLILNDSEDTLRTTTVALELSTTTDGTTTDGVSQTVAMPGSPESAASLRRTIVSSTMSIILLLGVVIIVTAVLAYCYKRRTCVRRSDRDDSSTGGPPADGYNNVPLSPRPLITAIEPQVAIETLGSPITTEPVTILRRTSQHERMPSLLRYSDENGPDPADVSTLGTTASTCLHPMTNRFSDEEIQGSEVPQVSRQEHPMTNRFSDEEIQGSEVPQVSRQEENGSEGQSLFLPCINGLNCKDVYQSYVKVWDKSSGQCHSVADGTSDESNV